MRRTTEKGKEGKMHPPAAALPFFEGGRIEISGSGAEKDLLLLGVKRILRFGEEEMCFARQRDTVQIEGQKLACVSYASGAVGLRGRIQRISFSSKEERK